MSQSKKKFWGEGYILKEITDRKQIEKWLTQCGIREHFDTPDLEFRAVSYERGEVILSPDSMLENILFLAEGKISIYGIRDDGTMSPITAISGTALLGDMEFCEGKASPLFAEARSSVVCLVLPLRRYREQLEHDVSFLHLVLHSLSEKLNMFASMEAIAPHIEDRVLFYMKENCAGVLNGVETAALHLRCSRRQLQRILRKLTEEERIEKTGKGKYRLVDDKK